MLERLMNEIRAGGPLDAARLALTLDTTPQMVEAMLEHLRRMGLLSTYENASCSEACQACSLKGFCDPNTNRSAVQLWRYDE
ncbi:MAG: FeoC-like transcriptional regulator [Anaerolineales bacterium]